jgi:hypothetical protein
MMAETGVDRSDDVRRRIRMSGGFLGCFFDESRCETTKIRSVRKPRDKSNVERMYLTLRRKVYTSVCVECFPLKAHLRRTEVGTMNQYQAIGALSYTPVVQALARASNIRTELDLALGQSQPRWLERDCRRVTAAVVLWLKRCLVVVMQ